MMSSGDPDFLVLLVLASASVQPDEERPSDQATSSRGVSGRREE
jgi:hypothetical protein